ncbi:unnamed protein product [Rangifer tarandus platyrhynchus]|uniref:Uncharacterized protein n=1 Tax=Rangifer tarandus platyrhynchus TaxID=3082113 RepID=A0AC59ZQN9_RANTA
MGMPGGGTVSEPQAAPSAPEKPPGTAILCNTCGNVCRGEVLRVQNKYFHIQCFICKACGCAPGRGCDRFIEGEVVSALGKTYQPGLLRVRCLPVALPAGGTE